MKTQIVKDHKGKPTGVFIPMKEWEYIKSYFPEIESIHKDLPKWQKDIIDQRLKDIEEDPKQLLPIDRLFDVLDR
ncbi:addiction module protein [Sinomicrobium sp.]